MLRAWIDALVYSNVWVAAAACALCWAASLSMGIDPAIPVLGVAFAGTLLVYDVDRLRDLERDRATTPARAAFVARHFAALSALGAAAGVAALGFGLSLGWRAALVLAPVLLLGLLHRRLKRFEWLKAAYISTAWVLVVVGLPAVLAPAATHLVPVGVVLAASLYANAVASNVRDREAASQRLGAGRALRIARSVAGFGVVLALLAPAPVRSLVAVPAAMLAALGRFRAEERYGLLVVDGALLLGGALTVAWHSVA